MWALPCLRRQLEPKPRNDWTAWLIVLIVTPFASDHVSEATACFARLNQSMAIGFDFLPVLADVLNRTFERIDLIRRDADFTQRLRQP